MLCNDKLETPTQTATITSFHLFLHVWRDDIHRHDTCRFLIHRERAFRVPLSCTVPAAQRHNDDKVSIYIKAYWRGTTCADTPKPNLHNAHFPYLCSMMGALKTIVSLLIVLGHRGVFSFVPGTEKAA